MRCFISVELPEEIKQKMQAVVNKLKAAEAEVKWVEAQNVHLTLKFLGWVEEKDLENLVSITEGVVKGFKGFQVRFEGLGTFPEGRSPRVVWVGAVSGQEEMKKIAGSLEKELAQAGFRSEEREFKSHATLGRVKGKQNMDKLKEKIAEFKDKVFGECFIDSVHIMKSTLTRKGPTYEVYKKIFLKGGK